jgi:coatomer protein complex subunit gamma
MLAGTLVGDIQVLVKLNFGIDAGKNVAMKMAVRSDSPETSEGVHLIISEA